MDARLAEVDDPVTRREVAEALADLLKLTPLKVTAAKRLAKAPRDRQAQNDLADTFERATVRAIAWPSVACVARRAVSLMGAFLFLFLSRRWPLLRRSPTPRATKRSSWLPVSTLPTLFLFFHY